MSNSSPAQPPLLEVRNLVKHFPLSRSLLDVIRRTPPPST